MKKLIAFAAALLFLVLTVSPRALAVNSRDYLGLGDLESRLPESAAEALEGVSIGAGLDVGGILQRILEKALASLSSIVKGAMGSAVAVLAAALLCSVASGFAPSGKGNIDYANLIGVLVMCAAGIGGVHTLIGDARAVIEDMSAFSTLLLPVLASASAVSGAAASGAAKYAAAALFLDMLKTLGERLVLPLIYLFVAASAAEAAFGGGAGGVAKLIGKMVKTCLTLLSLAFTVYLTATGLIASSADAATVKLTKTAISTLLPVVGGMVADAADAVASGMGVLRGAAGAFGVAAAVAICAVPFLKLTVGSLVFRAAAALSETVTDKRLTGFIEALASAYAMALGLAGTNLVMLLISIIAASKVVTG